MWLTAVEARISTILVGTVDRQRPWAACNEFVLTDSRARRRLEAAYSVVVEHGVEAAAAKAELLGKIVRADVAATARESIAIELHLCHLLDWRNVAGIVATRWREVVSERRSLPSHVLLLLICETIVSVAGC